MFKVTIYTDGACIGNPGPMGIGFILQCNGHQLKVARYIGEGTNNVAELTAVIEAFKAIKNKKVHAVLHTDSQLVYGFLKGTSKARALRHYAEEMKKLAAEFGKLEVVKVTAHADDTMNNTVDKLARKAAKTKKSFEERNKPRLTMSDAFFPWKLYINNTLTDEANSLEDVRKILSREGLKLAARGAEIKFVDTLDYTVLKIENGIFVWPEELKGKRYV
ncbi:ribonuclease H [Candidatus Desulfofervidus auxilii]|uniref:ribonuclease H n=1 Tax=Desulfofervidus auxilii TaxID=1621989 RepID=A0A7U4QJW1_DESA2|nr:ribonuclease HI [Candidatus Desulfofervidus auxilii]AMM40697.1 ribonuclease H [Candidatus Desulfofervidus auxilii]